MANFDTALSDGNFAFSGGAFHDGFSDFVSNEHIDWTNATDDLFTTGNISVGDATINIGTVASMQGGGAVDIDGTYTGTASEIGQVMSIALTDNRDTADTSLQALRFVVTRASTATAEATVGDFLQVITHVCNADMNKSVVNYNAGRQQVGSGKTLLSSEAFLASGPNVAGTLTTWYGFRTNPAVSGKGAVTGYSFYADISNNTTNWAFYSAAGDSLFQKVFLESIASGATQAAAGAAANELWKTSGHATLPDNVLMIGVQ